MAQLSAIVITKNEAAISGRVSTASRSAMSASWSIAAAPMQRWRSRRKRRPREFHEWRGFGPQKNYALSLATGTWVLSLDADELVTAELAAAIKAAIADGERDAWEFLRLSNFCGRQIYHSGWYPDYVLRLFRRGKGGFDDVIVHERVICDGIVKRLRPPLLHLPMSSSKMCYRGSIATRRRRRR